LEGRKIVWAAWKKVCEPREAGGLAIIDLKVFNIALLGKWIWRLGTKKGGLWKDVIELKYGGWRSLREQRNPAKMSLWWKVLKEVCEFESWGRRFEDRFKWKIENGKSISFWEDNWEGRGNLKSVFRRLCSLSCLPESKVAECGYWVDGVWKWNLLWRRNLFEWEKDLERQHFEMLQGLRLVLDMDDGWVWKNGEFSMYTINSAYVLLRGEPEGGINIGFVMLWKTKALPSAQVTAWRVFENKLATKGNLVRRGVELRNV